MSKSIISSAHFHNEEAAYKFVETRAWPKGPICPHCGGVERIGKMGGTSTRIGTYKCYDCRKPFTVKVGTIFESSHIPLRLWLQAICLIASSKKGISSNQLHRTLGVTLKSAWFMSHRIREAMRSTGLSPMGQGGGGVEIDETYIGRDPAKSKLRCGPAQKHRVLSLRGVYQHCAKEHLHRYLAEFDFRHSNRMKLGFDDAQRADNLLKGVSGKRLTYQTASA